MRDPSLPALRTLLVDAGYHVLFRTNGWAECYIQRESERWEGRGHTADEALGDALAKMLPSHLARTLTHRQVSSLVPVDAVDTVARAPTWRAPSHDAGPASPTSTVPVSIALAITDHPGPAAVEDAGAGEPVTTALAAISSNEVAVPLQAEAALATPDIEVVTAPPPPAVIERAPIPPAAVFSKADPVVAVEKAAPSFPADAGPSPSTARAAPRTADALDAVERELTEIDARLGHLARMNSDRQRLHLLVWICRGRALEQAHSGSREVEQAVARVARRLTDLAKMFWPGSVRAMQLSAQPGDVKRELHAIWASEPATWRDATALAERFLAEHLAKSSTAGLDEDGWADAAARTPPPANPDELLSEADGEIRAILVPSGEVPNGRAGDLSSAELERLLGAARRLRWVRGAARDDLAWGVSMGRLRRALPTLGDRGARVREVLDHRTKPSVPWAKLLGQGHAEPTAPPGENPDLLRAELPAAGVTKDGLLAWLVRAFDVLNTPELVALLVPYKGELESFDEDTLNHPDRRVRRRLRDLVKRMASAAEAAPPSSKTEVVVPDDDAADEKIAVRALDELAARVRRETQGRRVLFVSNREDPELGARLTELLGIEITWCDGSLRRVQAQCVRIKGGAYDIILSATGFQLHGVDGALVRAASGSSVRYVRVNRGRPVACVQAIAREFGLSSGADRVEGAKAAPARLSSK